MITDPLVSISCITYNHINFIEQCLNGFLNQKTNFKFEILIHDDASTDGTKELIEKYKEQYPDIIKPLYQKENQYSQGVRGIMATFNFSRAKSKYIAICEGDDYWVDPLKLQKQVDFLERNEEYTLAHSDVNIHIEQTNKIYAGINKIKDRSIKSGDVFIDKLESNYRIFTCTALFRNIDITILYKEHKNYMQGDLILFLELAKNGLVKYFDEPMATYRVNQGSLTQSGDTIQKEIFKQSSVNIRLAIAKKYNVEQSIIDNLKIKYNKIVLELAYLKNDAELMRTAVSFLNEKDVKLNRSQNYKISIVLDKGMLPLMKKTILKATGFKNKVIGRLSDYKNRYI